jgi:hypothetical protein
MPYRDAPVATVSCHGCRRGVPEGSEICPRCRSPIDIGQFAELELTLKPDIRAARTFMGVVAALGLLGAVLEGATIDSVSTLLWRAMPALFFAGCFLAAFKAPLGAAITALAAFLFLQAATLAQHGLDALLPGIIIKIILVVLLVSGIRAGYRARDLRGQWRRGLGAVGVSVLAASTALGLVLGLIARI